MTSTEEIRRQIAAIFDPHAMSAGYDPDRGAAQNDIDRAEKAALAKADQVLSLLSLSPLPEGCSSRPGPIDGADNGSPAVASAGAGDAATQAFEALSKAANTILALVTAKVGRALYEAPEEDLVPLMATYGVELPAKLFRMLFDAADPELIASPPDDPAMGNRSPLPAPDAGAAPGMDPNPELVEALREAEKVFTEFANGVCGNEQHRDHGEFFKGYNSVTRKARDAAWAILPRIEAALSKATAQRGEG